MKKKLYREIEIPEGIEVTISEDEILVKGAVGENKRTFNFGKLEIKKEGNKIIIGNEKSTKTEKKMMNSITAHIGNLIKGVQKKFEYKLKICHSHFPFTVKIDGTNAQIKNFLGEKIDREFLIPENVEVKIEKEFITTSSIDKELAGQVAANFEIATKIKGRDKRIFQDGIYIIEKDGKEM